MILDGAAFAQFALSGLTTGCIYALVALGFVLCANVSGVVNFAQGEYVALGALVGAATALHGTPLPLALLAAAGAGGLVAFAQELLTVRPVRERPEFIQITVTLGVAAVLRGLALIVFGKDPLSPTGFNGNGTFTVAGAVLPLQVLWVWGATALLLSGVFVLLARTPYGRTVRACAVNARAARLMGIDAARTSAVVFLLAGATGALGGAIIAPISLASWSAGIAFGLKGFIGAAIGGFRNPILAVGGGLGLGVFEALVAGFISSSLKETLVYALLLAYVLIRGGVFARRRRLTAAAQ